MPTDALDVLERKARSWTAADRVQGRDFGRGRASGMAEAGALVLKLLPAIRAELGGVTDAWQPIETAPKNKPVLLRFPPLYRGFTRELSHSEMVKVDTIPVTYPRKPTHWAPIPPTAALNPTTGEGEQS